MSTIVLTIYRLAMILSQGMVPIIPTIIIKSIRILFSCQIGLGAQIGEGSFIGANAVVIKNIPSRSLVIGVPGKIIKTDIDINQYL